MRAFLCVFSAVCLLPATSVAQVWEGHATVPTSSSTNVTIRLSPVTSVSPDGRGGTINGASDPSIVHLDTRRAVYDAAFRRQAQEHEVGQQQAQAERDERRLQYCTSIRDQGQRVSCLRDYLRSCVRRQDPTSQIACARDFPGPLPYVPIHAAYAMQFDWARRQEEANRAEWAMLNQNLALIQAQARAQADNQAQAASQSGLIETDPVKREEMANRARRPDSAGPAAVSPQPSPSSSNSTPSQPSSR